MVRKDYFIKLFFGILLLLPVTVAMAILLLDSYVVYLSIFLVLLEIPFTIGIISSSENKRVIIGTTFIGLVFSYVQSNTFGSIFSLNHFSIKIISFLLYQWAWLAMFQAGLQISLEKIEHIPLLNAMTIAFASVGAICWFWFSYIF